jgi:hypothetical protein
MGRAVHAGINEIGLALDSVAGIVLEDAGLGLKELCEKNGPLKPCFAVTALVMRPFLKTNCQPLCQPCRLTTLHAAHFALIGLALSMTLSDLVAFHFGTDQFPRFDLTEFTGKIVKPLQIMAHKNCRDDAVD